MCTTYMNNVDGPLWTSEPARALPWEFVICGLLLVTPIPKDEEMVGCNALQSTGCCYLYDALCTIPYRDMQSVETGNNRLNLALFAFHEACWPCMSCLQLCSCYKNEDIQRLPRSMGFQLFDQEEALHQPVS